MTGPYPKYALILLLLIGLSACSGPAFLSDKTDLEERFQQRALELEQRGELHQALLTWRVAAALNPENTLMTKIIGDLVDTIEIQSNNYFADGVVLFNKGEFDQARRMFIKTLHLKPGHMEALHYVKHLLPLAGYQHYTVRKGDSFTRIAADVYQDAEKGYLLAYFNDLDPDKPLLTGTLLVLPKFPGSNNPPSSAAASPSETATTSKDALKDQTPNTVQPPEKGTAAAEMAVSPRPSDENQYQVSLALIEKGRYTDALVQLKKISPKFKGREEAIAKVNGLIQKRTVDAELQQARTQLAQKSFQKAHDILENILAQSPDRDDARSLMDEARYGWARELMAQDRESEAIALLQTLGPLYDDAENLIVQAKGMRNARAEKFYRSGVKHYLNEELELAVEDWKNALALNPEHPKAATDMENAIKLLEKWRDINPKERQKGD